MRQILAFSVGVVLGAALLIALLVAQEGTPTPSSKWAYDLYRVKESHAAKSESGKLLIVAGSNSLFGIDAAKLERELGIPTTNFGVHAGLGLHYILERSKRSLHKGDIVYLPLEYALYQQDTTPSQQLMDFAIARDPQYLHSLSIDKQFLGYANVTFSRIFEGIRGGDNRYLGRSAQLYNVKHVDARGNQINNTKDSAAVYHEKLSKLKAKNIDKGKVSSYSKDTLQKFFNWAKQNGVCIIGAPPNLLDFPEYRSDTFATFIDNIRDVYDMAGLQFVGDPYDYLLPEELFFDTEYHLNSDGVAIRTQMTINDLAGNLPAGCNASNS